MSKRISSSSVVFPNLRPATPTTPQIAFARPSSYGSQQEKTEWYRLVFYSGLADIVGKYLRKGSRIFVEGRLQTSQWTDKDGIDRHTTEIAVSEMQMLDAKKVA